MTQRGPVPLPVSARYSVPLRVRGRPWQSVALRSLARPGRPFEGPLPVGRRAPARNGRPGSTGTGQWLQLEVASGTVALGLGARTHGAGLLLVGPPGCLRFGTAGPRCLS